MFSGCKIVRWIQKRISVFCTLQWTDFKQYEYNDIPNLLISYSPKNIMKISLIRALWLVWCKVFYEQEFTELEFISEVMDKFNVEMRLRINEAPAVTQWLKIVSRRRTDNEFEGVSEKEFLLKFATSIKKSEEFLPTDGEDVLDLIKEWDGSKHFFEILKNNNYKFKMKVHYKKIKDFFAAELRENNKYVMNVKDHPAICNATDSEPSESSESELSEDDL